MLGLIDGSNYFYRAFFSAPKHHRAECVRIFKHLIRGLLDTVSFDRTIFVMDGRKNSFRNQLLPSYKIQRPPMVPELVDQLPHMRQAVVDMGIPTVWHNDYEADDMIASICHQCADQAIAVVSLDKDLIQLMDERVVIFHPKEMCYLNLEDVKKKFGVLPTQIVDFLSLVGDSADNIPGIPGVGPKTAQKWLNQFHNLELLFENHYLLPTKYEVLKYKAQVYLAKELIKLKNDIPMTMIWDEKLKNEHNMMLI